MDIRPEPTEEEAAAIAAAIQQVVLRPVVVLPAAEEPMAMPAWRFSGRWWSRPIPVRRARPWS